MVFDANGFLKRIGGDREIADVVLDAFLEDFPLRIAKLQDAIARSDMSLLWQQAHSIRGAAISAGAVELGALAEKLELISKNGDLQCASEILDNIPSSVESLRTAIQEWRRE